MSVERLEVEQATAYFDEGFRLIRVAYRGKLGSEVTVQVYDWIDYVVSTMGLENILGEIFDFSEVEEFLPENLQTARKTSKRMNVRLDTSQLPVALIVKTSYQEEMLRGPMQVSPEHMRKRIVKSEEEALVFIDEWLQQHRQITILDQ
jgi:hypothetical protein